MGPFSSESETKQTTTDRSVQASEQALVYQPTRSGNARTSTRTTLAKGATLTINNGLGSDEFNAGLTALGQALAAQAAVNPNSEDDDVFKQAVLLALEKRVEASTERAEDEVESASPSNVKNYVAWAIGVVVVFALVLVFGRKKK